MERTIVIYDNTDEKTEELVGYVCRVVKEICVCDVIIKNVVNTDENDLLNSDLILVGLSTLSNSIIEFFEKIQGFDLKGREVAVFENNENSGTQLYSFEKIQQQLIKCNLSVLKRLRINKELLSVKQNVTNWILEIVKK